MTDAAFRWSIDEDEAAENAIAEQIGFRTNPSRANGFALSMIRSGYRNNALDNASIANGEKTREQLDALSIPDVSSAIEFLSFCSGYLAARMFLAGLGEGPVLTRLLLADDQPIDDGLRKESIERAQQYLPALSEIHDNRASPRDSRLVHKLLSGYLAILIEDPRQTTLDTLLRGFEEPDNRRGASGFTARQIAESLDRSRNWATLGWRRGQAERRFRAGTRGDYFENLAGDVRIVFDRNGTHIGFADIRRIRYLDLSQLPKTPHPCDDPVVAAWMAENCALARQAQAPK
jgi:hypothetical protein